jgi:hypothetical protein
MYLPCTQTAKFLKEQGIMTGFFFANKIICHVCLLFLFLLLNLAWMFLIELFDLHNRARHTFLHLGSYINSDVYNYFQWHPPTTLAAIW